jgi:hypothetical protein
MDEKIFHKKYACHIFHLNLKAGIKIVSVSVIYNQSYDDYILIYIL